MTEEDVKKLPYYNDHMIAMFDAINEFLVDCDPNCGPSRMHIVRYIEDKYHFSRLISYAIAKVILVKDGSRKIIKSAPNQISPIIFVDDIDENIDKLSIKKGTLNYLRTQGIRTVRDFIKRYEFDRRFGSFVDNPARREIREMKGYYRLLLEKQIEEKENGSC